MDYDEVGDINSFHLDLAFAADSVIVSVAERTGLVNAKFVGRRAESEDERTRNQKCDRGDVRNRTARAVRRMPRR
jgi:hypothetical protein